MAEATAEPEVEFDAEWFRRNTTGLAYEPDIVSAFYYLLKARKTLHPSEARDFLYVNFPEDSEAAIERAVEIVNQELSPCLRWSIRQERRRRLHEEENTPST